MVIVAFAVLDHAVGLDDGIDRDGFDIRIGLEGQKVLAVNLRGQGLEPPVVCFNPIAVFLEAVRDARRPTGRARTMTRLRDVSPFAAAFRSTRSSFVGRRFESATCA